VLDVVTLQDAVGDGLGQQDHDGRGHEEAPVMPVDACHLSRDPER
jgi:hypothetical protein